MTTKQNWIHLVATLLFPVCTAAEKTNMILNPSIQRRIGGRAGKVCAAQLQLLAALCSGVREKLR